MAFEIQMLKIILARHLIYTVDICSLYGHVHSVIVQM